MIFKRIIFFLLAGGLIVCSSSFENKPSDGEEYNIKAAFLYRFIDYVEWNNNESRTTFNIVVLGNSGILNPLVVIANEKKAKNNKIVVRQDNDISDIGPCQILFVSKNCTIPLETILSKFEDRSLLIITEQKGAAEKGAHINFLIYNDKLKFEVNLKTASRSGLKISSQLLQHASVVFH
jgi:hypothetical protein